MKTDGVHEESCIHIFVQSPALLQTCCHLPYLQLVKACARCCWLCWRADNWQLLLTVHDAGQQRWDRNAATAKKSGARTVHGEHMQG